MPQKALYLRWRPMHFEDVIGQEHVTRTLRNALKAERVRHAYLFSGPRGTGKTTTARLLAKAINCQHPDPNQHPCNACDSCIAVNEERYTDLIEIDAATHTGVDDVRDLRDKIAFAPGEGRYKVYIIDEVHRFSGSAFDALLKTLEEPPAHAIFVLATTEIDRVPQTIKSRCLQFEFRRVSLMEVADRLQAIAEGEHLHIDRAALELIARQGTGSVRDSISLLDQIVSDPDEHITLAVAQRILGTANTAAVQELVQALAQGDVPQGLHIINQAMDTGSDPLQFGQQVVAHLRAVMITQTASADLVEASEQERARYVAQAQQFERQTLLHAVRTFNKAVNEFKGGWQPQLSLELALIESLRAPQEAAGQAPPQVVYVQAPAAGGARGGAVGGTAVQPATPDSGSAHAADTVPDATAPGAPPLVPLQELQGRWPEVLRAINKYSSNASEVMRFYQVIAVDGNRITLATDNELYFSRISGYPEKIKVIRRALYDVHEARFVIDVQYLAPGQAPGQTSAPGRSPDNPLFRQARDLGADIHGEEE